MHRVVAVQVCDHSFPLLECDPSRRRVARANVSLSRGGCSATRVRSRVWAQVPQMAQEPCHAPGRQGPRLPRAGRQGTGVGWIVICSRRPRHAQSFRTSNGALRRSADSRSHRLGTAGFASMRKRPRRSSVLLLVQLNGPGVDERRALCCGNTIVSHNHRTRLTKRRLAVCAAWGIGQQALKTPRRGWVRAPRS